jgi:hypothetical protein
MTADLLRAGSAHRALLHRAAATAHWRLGEPSAVRQEIGLALTAARRRSEDYEIALALDMLRMIGSLNAEQEVERDAILERLGVVRLPALAGVRRGDTDERFGAHAGAPVNALAGR